MGDRLNRELRKVSGREQLMSAKIKDELRALGRYMIDNQLVWGSSGNISARIGEDRFLISASGAWLGDLSRDDLVECSISDSRALGERKPSKEFPYIGNLRHAAGDQCRYSFISFYSTLIACTKEPVFNNWFVESMYYLERVGRVGYSHPGSDELAESVKRRSWANALFMKTMGSWSAIPVLRKPGWPFTPLR